MDVYVLLDVLLVILIALFIPIGFWRGAYREAFVTLGILFGAALGLFWGESWGVELAAVTRLQESGGAFMIAMLCLISATFLLGYSSGAALPVPNPGWVSRVLGSLIAAANGALLLSFALGDIREYLLSADDSGFLGNALIALFLAEGTGWILLVAAAIFVPIALVLALFGPDIDEEEEYFDEEYELYEEPYAQPYAQQTMQRPGYAAPSPHRAPTAAGPRPAPAEETRPIPSPGIQQPSLRPRPQPQARAQAQPQPQQVQSETHQAQPQPQQAHGQPQQPPPAHARPRQKTTPEASQQPVETHGSAAPSGTTQPHRPQFGPQPGREAVSTNEAETKTARQHRREQQQSNQPQPQSSEESQPQSQSMPSFGTRSVEESYAEQQVIFGHRPSQRQEFAGAPREVEHQCLQCGAKLSGGATNCPSCGASRTASE